MSNTMDTPESTKPELTQEELEYLRGLARADASAKETSKRTYTDVPTIMHLVEKLDRMLGKEPTPHFAIVSAQSYSQLLQMMQRIFPEDHQISIQPKGNNCYRLDNLNDEQRLRLEHRIERYRHICLLSVDWVWGEEASTSKQ